jgi:hypothetical protein
MSQSAVPVVPATVSVGPAPPAYFAIALATPALFAPSAFQKLWLDALRQYREKTGVDLLRISYIASIVACETVDDVLRILEGQDKNFSEFRRRGQKIRDALAPVVRIVEHCNNAGSEAAAAASVRDYWMPPFASSPYVCAEYRTRRKSRFCRVRNHDLGQYFRLNSSRVRPKLLICRLRKASVRRTMLSRNSYRSSAASFLASMYTFRAISTQDCSTSSLARLCRSLRFSPSLQSTSRRA